MSLLDMFDQQIGIDLGSYQTRVWSAQRPQPLIEATCLAIDRRSNRVIAVGNEAFEMFGRVSGEIEVVFPVQQGTIVQHQEALAFLKVLLQKVVTGSLFFRPTIVMSISGVTNSAEREVITELLYDLGTREVYTVAQLLAAAIGSGVPIADASGTAVLYVGGGVVEAGVVSLGSVVAASSAKLGTEQLVRDLQQLIRRRYELQVSLEQARRLMIQEVSLDPEISGQVSVTGQAVADQAPQEIVVQRSDFLPVAQEFADQIASTVTLALREIPPELTADVIDKGVLLTGAGAELKGLVPHLLSDLGVPVTVVDQPDRVVISGVSQILENLDEFKKSLGYV